MEYLEIDRRPKRLKLVANDRTGTSAARLDFEDSEALDTGLIAAGQAVEHYEISRYGTLRARANSACVMPQGSSTRRSGEEKKTDELLTQLAQTKANPKADKAA